MVTPLPASHARELSRILSPRTPFGQAAQAAYEQPMLDTKRAALANAWRALAPWRQAVLASEVERIVPTLWGQQVLEPHEVSAWVWIPKQQTNLHLDGIFRLSLPSRQVLVISSGVARSRPRSGEPAEAIAVPNAALLLVSQMIPGHDEWTERNLVFFKPDARPIAIRRRRLLRVGSRGVDWRGRFTVESPSLHRFQRLELYEQDADGRGGQFIAALDASETERWRDFDRAAAWLMEQRPPRGSYLRLISDSPDRWFRFEGIEGAFNDAFLDPDNEREIELVPTIGGPRTLLRARPEKKRRRRR